MSRTQIYGLLSEQGNRSKEKTMRETMTDAKVTYTLSYEDKIYIIENVPARVCEETGEQFFAPVTVEHIHKIIKSRKKPDKVIETPVYEYT